MPVQHFQLQATERQSSWLLSLREVFHSESSAFQDWRFASLPDFSLHRFETALAIPLTSAGTPIGLLTAARLASGGFNALETASLLTLQAPLEGLLAAAASRAENARLKSELQKANDRLAGRKHIERAKGIIQSRHGWTEEEAYLHLRRISRKTRRPMQDIARSVIVHSTSGFSPKAG